MPPNPSRDKRRVGRPLRVGFYVFFPSGGIGRYTHMLMCAMGRHPNVHVEAICSPDYKWARDEEYATWDGLQCISHQIPLRRQLRFLIGQFVNPHRAVQHAIHRNLDVLHLANINHLTFPYWRLLLRNTPLKVVASVHDVRRQKSILSRTWEDHQLKAFYRYADALFVHSTYQVRALEQFAGVSPEKIFVVPHGLYPHGRSDASRMALREKWSLPAEKQVALFFGQLRDEKNLEGLLRALPLAHTPLHVVVAGKGGGRHRDAYFYRTLARKLGIRDRVTFVNRHIEDDEVAELFKASDWVALPYDPSFTSQSGVLNTAASYERPVLVSTAPVLKETVQTCDIGWSYEGTAPVQIAQGIDAISEQIAGGYDYDFDAYQQQFSWAKNAARTVDVYRLLLD